jgi:hypothetical protein
MIALMWSTSASMANSVVSSPNARKTASLNDLAA